MRYAVAEVRELDTSLRGRSLSSAFATDRTTWLSELEPVRRRRLRRRVGTGRGAEYVAVPGTPRAQRGERDSL